ncbi:hypothetical protein CDAR_244321 [Caerostris darwini]|uniref:Secreted protein n=1 Tax=Caerostris darwini TaxID=1538125 RepID=A0AAV4RHM7_9ARAC|nr:hypothetical protein CDAR_244321 [Caerostris darwini]
MGAINKVRGTFLPPLSLSVVCDFFVFLPPIAASHWLQGHRPVRGLGPLVGHARPLLCACALRPRDLELSLLSGGRDSNERGFPPLTVPLSPVLRSVHPTVPADDKVAWVPYPTTERS